jgi:hypothetical protein
VPVKLAHLQLLYPWRHIMREACEEYGEDPFRLAACGLRESLYGYARGYEPKGDPGGTGDRGYALGFWQIDRRYHREFWNRQDRSDPLAQARYACGILRDHRAWFKRNPAFRSDDPARLERAVWASYNAGPAKVARAVLLGQNPDAPTTGGDYGADVIGRGADLLSIAPDLFALESKPLDPAPVPAAEVIS